MVEKAKRGPGRPARFGEAAERYQVTIPPTIANKGRQYGNGSLSAGIVKALMGIDIGKSAKRMGSQHPRDVRKQDPVPPKPTPKAKPRSRLKKIYGFSFEYWYGRTGPESKARTAKRHFCWYADATSRDQAMKTFMHKTSEVYRDFRKEARELSHD